VLLLALIFLLPLEASAQAPPANPARPIHIGIIGDQTFSEDIQASYGVLSQGVNMLSSKPIDVVLHVGDLVESTLPTGQVAALFSQATGILSQLPAPWCLTAGDHDVSPPVFQQDSPDHSREELFQQLYGARVPQFAIHPWYSFDQQGFHFISLYSFGSLDSDSRFGNIFLSQVYDDQFEWLQADLAAHADARAIIVWVHQPLWYHVSGWKRVHELLRQYPVAAVISGHFHYNQDVGVLDGIHYYTVGATGGFEKNGNRQAGDVDHVSILMTSAAVGRLRYLMGLLAAVALFSIGARAEAVRIGIVGDQTGVDPNTPDNLDQSYKVLASAMAVLKARHLDGVLHTGDLVETQFTPDQQKYRELFNRAAGLLNAGGAPWYLTPGDHDVNPPGDYTPDSSVRTFEGFFRAVYKYNGAPLPECLCYSFDIRGFHFVALNSLEHLGADPRWGGRLLLRLVRPAVRLAEAGS
jgi:3',5'-cyclic AMP phosphodiesterase CpdA